MRSQWNNLSISNMMFYVFLCDVYVLFLYNKTKFDWRTESTSWLALLFILGQFLYIQSKNSASANSTLQICQICKLSRTQQRSTLSLLIYKSATQDWILKLKISIKLKTSVSALEWLFNSWLMIDFLRAFIYTTYKLAPKSAFSMRQFHITKIEG